MVEAGECCRKIEKQKCSVWMSAEVLTYCLVYVDDVGGYVAVVKEPSLLGAAEFVGKGSEDKVEE